MTISASSSMALTIASKPGRRRPVNEDRSLSARSATMVQPRSPAARRKDPSSWSGRASLDDSRSLAGPPACGILCRRCLGAGWLQRYFASSKLLSRYAQSDQSEHTGGDSPGVARWPPPWAMPPGQRPHGAAECHTSRRPSLVSNPPHDEGHADPAARVSREVGSGFAGSAGFMRPQPA